MDSDSSIEIDAPASVVYAAVADVEMTPQWQPDMTELKCLRRDKKGRATRISVVLKTAIRDLEAEMKITYEEPHAVHWELVKGDVRSFTGSWTVEPITASRSCATYETTIDFGGKMGVLMRGPAVNKMHNKATSSMPLKLKRFVEARELAA